MNNNDFDSKNLEEQEQLDKRKERLLSFRHTEDLISICYSILRLSCLMVVTFCATWSVVGLGVRKWLSAIITILNRIEWPIIVLVISLCLISLISKATRHYNYFKK